MTPIAYESVRYDRSRHEAFVKVSWCRALRCQGVDRPWRLLLPHLTSAHATTLVAHVPGLPDDLLGWACVDDGAIVWAYTRELYGRVRGRGLATSLLLEAGVDVSQPTPMLFWSPDAAAIAARGYRHFYAPRPTRHERTAA